MGYYIQTPENHGKADYLVREHGAEVVDDVPAWSDDYAIVCVVDNGAFEAAGYAFSPRELMAFAAQDRGGYQRPRTWLKMDKAKAQELSGYKR